MWASADRCEFFKIKLTVSLFILCLKRFVSFESEAACCVNRNKGGIFLSFPVSVWKFLCDIYNVSSQYFHRYVKDTLVAVTFSAWTVCTWKK